MVKKMIEVEIRENRIKITGHAEYAKNGEDIVCAAVTILAQTLVKAIEEICGYEPAGDADSGYFELDTQGISDTAALLVNAFVIGLHTVKDEFPDYIRFVQA